MNWRKWKLGCFVTFLMSLFVAMSGLVEGMSWQAFLAVFGASLVTHFTAFLHEHPVESIVVNGNGREMETVTK